MRRARRCISSRADMVSRDMVREDITGKDSQDIIRSRDRMGRQGVIMMIDGVDQMGSWRRCWRVWRVVVVWMLVCCFKGWKIGTGERGGCTFEGLGEEMLVVQVN